MPFLKTGTCITLINATQELSYSNLTNVRDIGPNQSESAFKEFFDEFSKYHKDIVMFSYEKAQHTPFHAFETILVTTENHPLPREDFNKTEQIFFITKLVSSYNDKLVTIGLLVVFMIMSINFL